ncbi:uncharacterized protein V6R79_004985 [Siganus canaliculatus]
MEMMRKDNKRFKKQIPNCVSMKNINGGTTRLHHCAQTALAQLQTEEDEKKQIIKHSLQSRSSEEICHESSRSWLC